MLRAFAAVAFLAVLLLAEQHLFHWLFLFMPGMLAALAVSIGAAWLLWRYVELPAQRWSSCIRYAGRRPQKAPAADAVPVSPETAAG